jgi:hypothetical protein
VCGCRWHEEPGLGQTLLGDDVSDVRSSAETAGDDDPVVDVDT